MLMVCIERHAIMVELDHNCRGSLWLVLYCTWEGSILLVWYMYSLQLIVVGRQMCLVAGSDTETVG